jgi:hypothetical protein
LTQIRQPISNLDGELLHTQPGLGYYPQWGWRAFPGIGDAPQMVFETGAAIPDSICGPGDVPGSSMLPYKGDRARPTMVGSAFTQNGMPTTAGGIFYAPLTYQPIVNNPITQMFPGMRFA